MPSRDDATRFASAERYYTQFRPKYGAEAIENVRQKFAIDTSSRVLDLGCGPGHLAIPLAQFAGEVVGMDPNETMLNEARKQAAALDIENIDWVVGSDTDLDPTMGPFDLTVMGRSFHWMDRDRTLEMLYEMTKLGGGIAILTDGDWVSKPAAAWQHSVAELVNSYRESDDADEGEPEKPPRLHQDVIVDSAFEQLEIEHLEFTREWSIDCIVGYVFSLSYCSPAILGDAKEAFEASLRTRLVEFDQQPFTQHVELSIISARKPADDFRIEGKTTKSLPCQRGV